MENNLYSYKFKICLTIEEYTRALEYFEKLTNEVNDFTEDNGELIRRLKKGLTKQYKKYLNNMNNTLNEENSRPMRNTFRNLIDNYTVNLQEEAFCMVETLINCINNILSKTKDNKLIAIILCSKASLLGFLSQYSNEKSTNLELAYSYYKSSVEKAFKFLPKTDISRMKIAYSYAKFIFTKINDKYRSMIFILNYLDEINLIKNNENLLNDFEGDELDSYLKELSKIERKFKNFHESNIEDFNKIFQQYHPEYISN
jgi:predicted HicB family RNase H-like nuclease